MIEGLSFDYAQARIQSRHGGRPTDALWLQVQGARSFSALLEIARASPLRAWVSGIGHDATVDQVELRLRDVLRAAIAEAAAWVPHAWRPAVLWTQHLVDLPALIHLARGERPLPWMHLDPALAPYVAGDSDARRAVLRNGPMAFVARIFDPRALPERRSAEVDAQALDGWLNELHRRIPPGSSDDIAAIDDLVRVFRTHMTRFAGALVDEAWSLRRGLESRLALRFRRHALAPAAAFAHVAMLALDAERLRAALAPRAAIKALRS